MNLESLLASARPFLFHEDAADAPHDPRTPTTQPKPPTLTTQPARTQRPPSRWFLTPHALLRRSPWGRYALLGVFHRFDDASDYAARHYSFQTRPTYLDPSRSSAVWTDDEGYTYLICPHPNPKTRLRINPNFDPTVTRDGPYHLRYAEPGRRPTTQARFPTLESAYACLAMSRDLRQAAKARSDPAEGRWEWIFRDGARYVIQRRKEMSRTRWSGP